MLYWAQGYVSGRRWRKESGSQPFTFLLLDADRPIFWIFASLEILHRISGQNTGSTEKSSWKNEHTFGDPSTQQEVR